MTTTLSKAHVDALGGRRVLVAAKAFSGRPHIELRAKIQRRGRADVEEFVDLTPKQARAMVRVLIDAIAAAEAAARHDGMPFTSGAARGAVEDDRHVGPHSAG